MTTFVNFEIAKLLKEKGFDFYCEWSYWKGELTPHTPGYVLEDGTTSQENYWDFERHYAPTIAEVVMWLFDKHGVWICVHAPHKLLKSWYLEVYRINDEVTLIEESLFKSPTEAYEDAILYTLQNLIK